MKISFLLAKVTAALLLFALSNFGHELEENRATLVLRDRTHLSITLFIVYSDALRMALAPQRPPQEFLLMYSAMKLEDLQKELLRAQNKLQSATRLYSVPDGEMSLTNWTWPDATQVQALLQQRVMRAMVDPAGHAHEAPVEVHADANARQEVTSVRVQFPEELHRVLVVAYRPNQLWVAPKTLSPPLRF